MEISHILIFEIARFYPPLLLTLEAVSHTVKRKVVGQLDYTRTLLEDVFGEQHARKLTWAGCKVQIRIYTGNGRLVFVHPEGYLIVHDPRISNTEVLPLNLPPNFNISLSGDGSTFNWLFLDYDRLILVGELTLYTFLYTISQEACAEGPKMNHMHDMGGLVSVRDTVYVFGGWGTLECEKLAPEWAKFGPEVPLIFPCFVPVTCTPFQASVLVTGFSRQYDIPILRFEPGNTKATTADGIFLRFSANPFCNKNVIVGWWAQPTDDSVLVFCKEVMCIVDRCGCFVDERENCMTTYFDSRASWFPGTPIITKTHLYALANTGHLVGYNLETMQGRVIANLKLRKSELETLRIAGNKLK